MTQPEQNQVSVDSAETTAAEEQGSVMTHETIDPFLDNFAPGAEAKLKTAFTSGESDSDDASDTGTKEGLEVSTERAPGAPNASSLPLAGDTLALLEAAKTNIIEPSSEGEAGVTGTAPTTGPNQGAGDHEAAENAEPMTPLDIQKLEETIIDALRTIYDPEIPVNTYELGLIYELNIDPQGRAVVEMTLTSPACPVAGILPGEVEQKVLTVDGVNVAKVELVWDPPWTPDMMSEAAQLQLGFF